MKKRLIAAAVLTAFVGDVGADVITDWNARAGDILGEARLGTPPAVRAMALVQTSVYEAVSQARRGASIDAAVAAANRSALAKLLPAQAASIDALYKAALDAIPEGAAKANGIAIGEKAAEAVMARRAGDRIGADEYRPHAAAGAYVPTAAPAASQWSKRMPWNMASVSQFRPGPPPALTSEAWARDFNEVKSIGGKTSADRTAEQADIARFWEYSLPPIYFGVLRSVAEQPGRDAVRNARLYAAAAQAMDDGLISVFDAKYHYNFWRPLTAIRNGDIDGNDATQRDASWTPLIDTPMHPEFPSAHSVLAASVGAVLKADIGSGTSVALSTTSPTAKGVTRRWANTEAFVKEVADARIYAGIHYRSATDAGAAAGGRIGELAAAAYVREEAARNILGE